MEMGDEVLSSVGAQEIDTSGYQVSELEANEFYRENDQLNVVAVFRQRIDTIFSPTAHDNLETGGSAENPLLFGEKEKKENSTVKKSVSEKRIRPAAMLRSGSF